MGVRTVLHNLSSKDFCLRVAKPVKRGDQLLVITQLSQAILMLRGTVTRIQQDEAGDYRLCAEIIRHQIFSSLGEGPLEKLSKKNSSVRDSGRNETPRSPIAKSARKSRDVDSGA